MRPLPPCAPLEDAPLQAMPLSEPPQAFWISLGQHGRHPVEHYRLPTLWCLHLYRWTGALRVGAVTLPVRPGYASIIPPDTAIAHYFQTPAPPLSVHLSAGLFLPAVSNDRLDPPAQPMYLPTMQDLGSSFERLYATLEEAVTMMPTRPRRAEARLWEVLWQLSERAPQTTVTGGGASTSETSRTHPVVVQAQEMIELRLGETLRVAELADALGLSHNHLTRLFQVHLGSTVAGYIRDRRVARARSLLLHSTVPIKAIAAQVGLPDLHQFNKTIRASTGLSPRKHREANDR